MTFIPGVSIFPHAHKIFIFFGQMSTYRFETMKLIAKEIEYRKSHTVELDDILCMCGLWQKAEILTFAEGSKEYTLDDILLGYDHDIGYYIQLDYGKE